MKISKVKLNAATVVKHMSEKELKQYKIQLEKDGDDTPTISDLYKFMQTFYAEFKEFKSYVLNQFDKHGWTN